MAQYIAPLPPPPRRFSLLSSLFSHGLSHHWRRYLRFDGRHNPPSTGLGCHRIGQRARRGRPYGHPSPRYPCPCRPRGAILYHSLPQICHPCPSVGASRHGRRMVSRLLRHRGWPRSLSRCGGNVGRGQTPRPRAKCGHQHPSGATANSGQRMAGDHRPWPEIHRAPLAPHPTRAPILGLVGCGQRATPLGRTRRPRDNSLRPLLCRVGHAQRAKHHSPPRRGASVGRTHYLDSR